MLAVAVSFTEVIEVAPDATGICAWRSAGCLSDTELTVQLAVPSPLAQPLVNVGFWLEGWPTRATDTFAADPLFSVETCTVKAAFCPRLTLDCERLTLTQSSGWADVLVELALALVLALVLAPGLAARRASSEAEAAVWDGDEAADELEGDPDGELDPEGEPDPAAELDGAGGVGALVGGWLGLVLAAGELEEPEGEGDGVGVGDFDGFGVGVGVGVGGGGGVLATGRTWQLVSVFALALVEVPGLGEAAAGPSGAACAVPGRPDSTPRVRKPPPTTLSAVTRTRVRRMRIALSPLLIKVAVCS
jgi:hypothetical protein